MARRPKIGFHTVPRADLRHYVMTLHNAEPRLIEAELVQRLVNDHPFLLRYKKELREIASLVLSTS